MGHGIKDETKNTKIHYVTTGTLLYLFVSSVLLFLLSPFLLLGAQLVFRSFACCESIFRLSFFFLYAFSSLFIVFRFLLFLSIGYLVRALAHQPDRFHTCTHLIIDEVHERSVDGDLVCLLARDLLR